MSDDDKIGARIRFRPLFRFPDSKGRLMGQEVDAVVVSYGLVLHAWIDADGEENADGGYVVSEPVTGMSICRGWSCEQALDRLYTIVFEKGGPDAFMANVANAILEVKSRRPPPEAVERAAPGAEA